MPSTPTTVADRLAERALFAHLIDDAAVFPPARTPLEAAVAAHAQHRRSGYADLVGPLLVPAAAARDLLRLVEGPREPLRVGLIARPGTDPEVVIDALGLLRAGEAVDVVGVEMGWTPTWREVGIGGLPLSLEVPRGDAQAEAIADIAADTSDAVPLQAKFRTGATPEWAWPDAVELASFIRTAIDHDLGFKLTGGLHHAVRGDHPRPGGGTEPQHGVLNVLVATRSALVGAEVDELVLVLTQHDPAELVPHVTRMSTADAAIVRAFFTAYGCCEVTDPIGELAGLGLLEVQG
jgi:hypothetical protein